MSPDGVLDNVFDRYGNKYNLIDLAINKPKDVAATGTTELLNCSSTSYFNLFFDTNSTGPTTASVALQNQRRTVICKVFEDLSNFINSPLSTTGNKVNIWVRDINTIGVSTNGVLGLATGFYNVPFSNVYGGIADNEIWKTIHTGEDSFANVSTPLTPNSANSTATGSFYHGMVAFNFNNLTGSTVPVVSWHTSLTTVATSTRYDLYTIALHEIAHALGFVSLIKVDGTSKFNTGFKHYSRYDKFLKNGSNPATSAFLLNTSNTCSSSMYDYRFNLSLNPNILQPQTTPPSACIADNTACGNAVYYTNNGNSVPVYTPNCFSDENSLSHFEDQCFPNTGPVYGNNTYFVMSNANRMGVTKRYLKPEERIVLCDIGYSVKNTFGSAASLSTFSYGGATNCDGISVAGINDGINGNGTYTFTGNVATNIVISGTTLLVNDRNATAYECLQDITTGVIISANGTNVTTINFSSTVSGLHLLRYVPTATINGVLQRGNITYVYVYVTTLDFGACVANSNVCDLVKNGGFEENSGLPNNLNQVFLACGWGVINSPDLFNSSSSSLSGANIPCNRFGSENPNLNVGNSYAGFGITKHINSPITTYEIMKTRLTTPLIANTNYQLSFDLSLAEISNSVIRPQAFFSNNPNLISWGTPLPIPSSTSMLFTSNTYSTIKNGWEKITFNFTTGSVVNGEEYLYIGGLNYNSLLDTNIFQSNLTPNVGVTGCPAVNPWEIQMSMSYYYIDNVSLKTISNAVFNLPTQITCPTISLTNLASYIGGAPTNGVFSSPTPGIIMVGNNYTFDTAYSGTGIKTIVYTYTNNLGCINTLTKTINVIDAATLPTFNLPTLICAGSVAQTLPNVSSNGVSGYWTPLTVNNLISGTYIFTPRYKVSPCAIPITMTITVSAGNNLIANNDNFNVSNFANVTTSSILVNDTNNGVLLNSNSPNILITQVGTTTPSTLLGGIIINPNGTITILANTTTGTYTLQYQISPSCSNSNVATINVVVFAPISCPGKYSFDKICYNSTSQTTTQNFFIQSSWYSGFGGIFVNGLPATSAMVTIVPIGPLPNGVTINANGTLTIAPGTLPNPSLSFYVKFCTTGTPSYCTPTIPVSFGINSTIFAYNDSVSYNSNGTIISNTGNNNVLNNDYYSLDCINTIPANPTNVTFTTISAPAGFTLNPTGSILITSGVLPLTSGSNYVVIYKICDINNPTICQTANHTVQVPISRKGFDISNSENINIFDEVLKLYPNPVFDSFIIQLEANSFSDVEISLYNLYGQLVYNNFESKTNSLECNIIDLASGSFLAKILINDSIYSTKLIKK